ncbi:MAG: DegV family protein [Clostridiales bacterium]|nr:DegV family protein [Clostridiales bacterium]
MPNYVLSCCSTADLSREHFESRNIKYICFHYQLDGVTYPDDLGQTMPIDKFYQAMVDGGDTRTSQVNAEEFETYFASFFEQGLDVLHLTLSSGISGTYNSARLAKENVEAKYPGRKVCIVDSLAASSGFGLLMDKLADLRDEGMSLDELTAWAEAHKKNLHHWFFTSDLTFFIKGGRVSKTSGMVGKLLNICPLLNVSHEGKLIAREKIRTKRKVIAATVDRMAQFAENGTDYSGKCYISQSACYEDARTVADLVEARFPHLNGKVEINHIGTTIGSHTGPGTVALFFWGSERID